MGMEREGRSGAAGGWVGGNWVGLLCSRPGKVGVSGSGHLRRTNEQQ